MSQQILEAASYNYQLRTRLSDVNDLIAVEGKYHPNCYKQSMRYTAGTSPLPTDVIFAVSKQ